MGLPNLITIIYILFNTSKWKLTITEFTKRIRENWRNIIEKGHICKQESILYQISSKLTNPQIKRIASTNEGRRLYLKTKFLQKTQHGSLLDALFCNLIFL